MAKIDLEKFICSMFTCAINSRWEAMSVALKEQGLEYKNGQIEPVGAQYEHIAPGSPIPYKPKFKVGDFVVSDYCMGRVVELTEDAYLLDTEQGIPFSCEHNARLWTFQDAKDGDVIADRVDGTIAIFQSFGHHPDGGSFNDHSYCFLHCFYDGDFLTEGTMDSDYASPATKEQRDLLFQKMAEAGYEWDAEKKELKKIQKPDLDNTNGTIKFDKEDEMTEFEKSIYELTYDYKGVVNGKELKERIAKIFSLARKQIAEEVNIEGMVDTYIITPEEGTELGLPVACMVRAYRQGILDTLEKIKGK